MDIKSDPERLIGARAGETHFAIFADPPFSGAELNSIPYPVVESDGVSHTVPPAFEMQDGQQVLLGFSSVFFRIGREGIYDYLDRVAGHLGCCAVCTKFDVL